MLPYCIECGENTKSSSPQVLKAINKGTIILPKCAVCKSKIY